MLSTDSDALAYAFECYRSDVYAFLVRRTRNRHDAEELTQQTFVDAAATFGSGVWPRSTKAWLLAVARRRAADEARRRSRRLVADPPTVQDDTVELPITDALGRLSPDERRLLFLRFVEERTHSEIARALSCSEPTSRMRVSRALQRLRRQLCAEM